jgi:hypothetical protein
MRPRALAPHRMEVAEGLRERKLSRILSVTHVRFAPAEAVSQSPSPVNIGHLSAGRRTGKTDPTRPRGFSPEDGGIFVTVTPTAPEANIDLRDPNKIGERLT